MQDLAAERAFYADLFGKNPENEHITGGYEELHELALPQPPAGLVLDLGCGTGAHAVRLAQRGCDVIALDLVPEGVRSARARFARERLHGRFLVADAEHLPLRAGAVSVAWTFLLLHHFPKFDRLLHELSRVTREKVLAYEPNAQNLLTWLANNVINRFVGISTMTPNQRALRPGPIAAAFAPLGFRATAVHYVDRKWSDNLGWVRRTYEVLSSWLPTRFRANKFLIVLERRP
jgi:ubiquinone/menaquinone biosynthesis C-methylase UbiE